MKKIRIKDIFKVNDYSAPFMEVRLTLPIFIDNLLRKNDIESLKLGCRNIVEARMIDFKNMINPSIVVLLIFMIICAIASLLIMLKVFKYRNHPYLKLISPNLSNIIIFGFTLSIFTPLTNIQNSSIERCKYAYVYGSISSNLILFPMLLVTYRIYAIYTNQSQVNIGKKLSNNRLLIAVMISLFLVCSSTIYIVFTKEFYISTTGSIASYRYPVCNHEENIIHAAFEMIYEYSIVGIIIYMVRKSGKASKKFDEVKFIYVILIIMFVAFLLSAFFIYVKKTIYFLILCGIYALSCGVCIYLLVGSRLLYIAKHPQDSFNSEHSFQNYFNIIDIADFLPMKKGKEKNSDDCKFNKNKLKNLKKNSNSSINSIDDDPNINNPNNIFFYQGLAMLNQQSKDFKCQCKEIHK
eukprot:jgi/Orpsp1_1/1186448/evm.model.d7180000050659.1